MREYQLDLREVLWGDNPMGARRVYSLVAGLPLDSAYRRAAYPQQTPGSNWGTTEDLICAVLDAVNMGTIAFVNANLKKGHRRIPFDITKRPWEQPKAKRKATHEETLMILGVPGRVVKRGEG